MILDGLLQFSNAQNVFSNGTTVDSSNIIDFGGPALPVLANLQGARDMGIGDDPALKLLVQVTTAFVGGTSCSVLLAGATDNGSGAAAAFSTWYISPAYTVATLVAGERMLDIDFPRPPAGIAVPRFVKLTYTCVGNVTAGGVSSYIVIDRVDQPYSSTNNAILGGYPAGITVAN